MHLVMFRHHSHKNRIKLTEGFHKDIHWFVTFLPTFNCVIFDNKSQAHELNILHLDTSLTGLGTVWDNRVYSTPIFLNSWLSPHCSLGDALNNHCLKDLEHGFVCFNHKFCE